VNFARFQVGLAVGFIAVTVTTLLNIGLRLLGVFPDGMDFAHLADWAIDRASQPWLTFTLGVLIHVALGALVGGLFLVVVRRPTVLKGVAFMAPVWLVMNLVLFPLNGSGFFGQASGPAMAVGTLFLNVVFGALIGLLGERFHVVAGAPAR
jgi:hypothetical protein